MLVNLNDVLYEAKKGHYAVGLFNTIDTDMLQAEIEAAEEMNAPIIIGTAEILLPYGELKLIAPSFVEAAKRAKVPVVVHYDHGLTFDKCMEALQLGFSSVMFDGSKKPYVQNLYETKEMAKIAHSLGASIEGEIGHVGQAAQGDGNDKDFYTKVSDAVAYLKETDVDALAIAIGTAHGLYKSTPKLDFNRLKEIYDAVDKPLVLHGGSGLSDQDFINCVAGGISKVNIFTDLCLAGCRSMKESTSKDLDYLIVRNNKVKAIKEEVIKKMQLFGCIGKA